MAAFSNLIKKKCVELSHAASLPNEFSYLITLHITVATCDLILKSLVKEIQIDLNSAVILLNSSLCICLSFRAEVGTIFALSWLITWFGHVLSETKHTLRLYDFFLSSHPLMPIYLAATVRTCRGQQQQPARDCCAHLTLVCLRLSSRSVLFEVFKENALSLFIGAAPDVAHLPVDHYPETHSPSYLLSDQRQLVLRCSNL